MQSVMLSVLLEPSVDESVHDTLIPKTYMAAQHHTAMHAIFAADLDCVTTPVDAGFLGFYDGMKAKIVQSVLAAALLMSIKEELTTTARLLLDGAPPVAAAAEKIKGVAEIVQMNVEAAVQK